MEAKLGILVYLSEYQWSYVNFFTLYTCIGYKVNRIERFLLCRFCCWMFVVRDFWWFVFVSCTETRNISRSPTKCLTQP